MKKLFSKVEIKNRNALSKSDKKKINAKLGNILETKSDYKVLTISSKIRVFRDEKEFYCFEYFGRIIPTIKTFDRSLFKTIWLDAGALNPIRTGADVMAPGIIKYSEKCQEFENNEIVGIEIEDNGIFAVGLTTMSYKEMILQKQGPVVDILHVKGDELDLASIE